MADGREMTDEERIAIKAYVRRIYAMMNIPVGPRKPNIDAVKAERAPYPFRRRPNNV